MKKSKKNIEEYSDSILLKDSATSFAADYPFENAGIFNLIEKARTGIKYNVFEKIASKIPFTIDEWSKFLNISERTMHRYRKDYKVFEPIHSEKIITIQMLYDYGVEVFGNKEYFDDWLNSPNIALGDKAPKEYLDTSFGIEYIKNELTRIAHGVLA